MTNENAPQKPLLPHQQALIDQFFNNPTVRGYAVQWDVGLGSVRTIAHLIKKFAVANPSGRVLVLSPKVLTAQAHYHLAAVDLHANLVDRFRFRAMEDQVSPSGTIWHEGGIYVLGTDFARQDDITASLCTVQWDLLIIQEAHQIRGQKEYFVKKLVESSPAIRVVLLTLPCVDNLPQIGIENWKITTTRMNGVIDSVGRRVFDLPTPILRSIEIQSDAAECRLREAVANVVQLLNHFGPSSKLLVASIENSMQSSLSALEEVIRRLRNRLLHESLETFQEANSPDDETDEKDLLRLDAADNGALLNALDRCLVELDSISEDSKLKALTHLLMEAKNRNDSPGSTCILTKFLSTLAYIQTALDELGFATFVLHGSQSVGERFQVLEDFHKQEGILIASQGLMEGLNMPGVESLIMYDVPKSRLLLQQILGRFQRYGRSTALKVDVINDPYGTDLLNAVIRETIGGEMVKELPMNK
jgi:ERCC4-related helicase